ncbi:MAG: hypothetical protein ACKVP3_01595 [Hyphomicrobiaceae bacterium]
MALARGKRAAKHVGRLAARATIFGAALLLVAVAAAQAQQTSPAPATQESTHQKAEYLRLLTTDSVSARKIEDSGDVEAIANLETARDLVTEAHDDLAAGKIEVADKKLNDALRLINAETQRLSQDEVKEKRAEDLYNKRLKSVKQFLLAIGRVADEKGLSSSLAQQIEKTKQEVVEAERLARQGDFKNAREKLDAAYLATRADIRDMRQGDKLTRTLTFATAEEEYKYELDRNDSHFMLLDLAIAETQAPKSILPRIDKSREAAKKLRSAAEALSAKGDHAGAINSLVQSTDMLLKAIRLTGISLPG